MVKSSPKPLAELLIHNLLKKEVRYSLGVYELSISSKLICLYQLIAFIVSLELGNTVYILQVEVI